MSKTKLLAIALATTSLSVPAHAGGLLRGGANCLCQTLNGVRGSGTPSTTSGSGAPGSSMIRHGTISGRGSTTLNGTLGVTTVRSVDRRNGKLNGGVGLAGSVSSATNATLGAHGLGRGIGLAGRSSTNASVNKQVGVGLAGIGHGNGARSVGLANVSVLNRTGASGRHLANVAVLNGTGGMAGKVLNVSALNRTGATGRSLANVAVLNGTGGTSGKIANVSILNKTGTTGRSLANVAVLNGTGGTSGRIVNVAALNKSNTTGHSVANIAILNGRPGNGNGNGNGGLGLPHGVRIINGVPCGPDGKPLTGAAAVTVMAMINSKGGLASPSGGNGPGGATNSPGAGNGDSQGGQAATPRQRQERADHKDLWWPPHPEQQSRDGRLEDH